jgi:hypothetical protein
MTNFLPPSVAARTSGPDGDIDRLLREFYQAEMPDPWPRLSAPAAAPMPPPKSKVSWLRQNLARPLVLAAAVAFLLVGYGTLAAMFPAQPARSSLTPASPEIGHRPGRRVEPLRVITPRGNEARGWEQDGDGEIKLYLERIPSPAKQR